MNREVKEGLIKSEEKQKLDYKRLAKERKKEEEKIKKLEAEGKFEQAAKIMAKRKAQEQEIEEMEAKKEQAK